MASTFGALALARFGTAANDREIVTVTFLTLAFSQLWHVFNMRHRSSQFSTTRSAAILGYGQH